MKLSKESKYTFLSLLIIPFVWIGLNHFGYLDYLKIKTLDWRMQFRGEIRQDSYSNVEEKVDLPDGGKVPRTPKLIYVNFDIDTLEMDGVGERPWDRAFFRDTALALIEKGKARSLGFDFGFTPKSMSRMVPKENSYRSDMALAELVRRYPDRVVLGCLYSGVQTPYVKPTGVSAFPPFFKDGYSPDSGKFNYPESPSYPLLSYENKSYVGRVGSFTVSPYRAVDEIPRWVPLWYNVGGKAHAYNLLGGKRSVLSFELPLDNKEGINLIRAQINQLVEQKLELEAEFARLSEELTNLNQSISDDQSALDFYLEHKEKITSLNQEIENFTDTLLANEALRQVIEPQIESRQSHVKEILFHVLEGNLDESTDLQTVDDLVEEAENLKAEISTFQNTLDANPALSTVIKPQVEIRVKRRDELLSLISLKQNSEFKKISSERMEEAQTLLSEKIKELEEALSSHKISQSAMLEQVQSLRENLQEVETEETQKNQQLERLEGHISAELLETNKTLRLIYEGSNQAVKGGELVDTLPNEVPLFKEGRVFALGVESLLAYYGLGDEAVQIDEEYKSLSIVHPQAGVLVDAKLSDGQFLEVNWFSKWSESLEEKILTLQAKRAYVDKNIPEYLSLVPKIIRLLLERVEGVDIPEDNLLLPDRLQILGIEEEKVLVAQSLLSAKLGDKNIPSFEQFFSLLNAISYYFIPPGISSEYNPMCGMKDVLEYARFHDQVSETIADLENKIALLSGDQYLGKINSALELEPENQALVLQKEKISEAISINQQSLLLQREEMQRIEQFFSSFHNAIVLIGPEEKTFQDLAPTPFDSSAVPKVSVHGNLIKTLTSGEYLKRLPIKTDHLATLFVCVLMAFLAVYQGNHAQWVQAGGILLLIGYVYLGFETFAQSHVIWPITAPACAGLSTSFIGLAAMVVIEQKAKGRLKGMFGSYVSSDLVEQMVASGEEPSLGGEETAITAFFSDVQAFSSFSELLTPTGLVDLMNEYLTAMTNILQEERGTLDKYIGDAIVAMYGAPIPMDDHAYQAVRTAILMQQKQIELRKKWVPEVEKWGKCHGLVTQMQTRIGCNTGTATVGNMGALDRFNYTMMGDMVNLAARCESGAKAYGAYIMVTEETKLASEKTRDDIAFRYLDKIVVKGRSQPVAMFEPTGFMSELSQETQDCLDCFQQGIDKYLLQDWDGALNLFEKAKELEPNKPGVTPGVKDNPSMILIDRCKVMSENPPGDDWDGVYVMTTK
ncbi:MAG: adenylate/guanylate cyclase domain-containing protein [Opitutae bacterium]